MRKALYWGVGCLVLFSVEVAVWFSLHNPKRVNETNIRKAIEADLAKRGDSLCVGDGGACYGQIGLAKVINWQGPLKLGDFQTLSVKYTYKILTVDQWWIAERQKCEKLRGEGISNAPVYFFGGHSSCLEIEKTMDQLTEGEYEKESRLNLTNIGWEVVD